jgi:DegV family protein with EDD domain
LEEVFGVANVKIITDSTADIPKNLAEELGISVIPLKVHVGGESYLDGVTLSAAEFYERLRATDELPTTSQPSPLDFAEVYRGAINEGATEILSIHLSSALSGTYQSAVLAKGMIEEEHPGVTITVFDSKTATYSIGIIVVAVARAAKEGKTMEELVALAEYYRQNQALAALVDTLEYLQKGGRIGKAAALVGSLLSIKPIISINDDGEVYAIDKARGKNKAVSRVFELLQEKVPAGTTVTAAVLHADRKEQAEEWMEKLKAIYDVKEANTIEIGPVIGTHAGPGTIGCLVVPLKV